MKFKSIVNFGYTITKPFSRRVCYLLFGFGVLSLAAFSAINVFLVGYDVVTITTSNFNTTQRQSWTVPWESEVNFACEPHQFQLGSILKYQWQNFKIQGGFFYANNDLSSCDIVQYEIEVRPGDRLITSTILAGQLKKTTTKGMIQCPPPLGFQAVVSWSFSNHAMLGSLSAAMFPENSLARAIIDAMNSFSNDAYQDIYNGLYIANVLNGQPGSQKVYKVVADGQPACNPDPPFTCVIPEFNHYNAIGNIDLNIIGPSSIMADEGQLYNVMNIFYAAVRLDLGHWTADNIFTNTTSFNNSIVPTDSVNLEFRSLAASKGMAYVNFTTPPPASARTSPAAIQIQYTCNIRKRKPVASFIVSVVSATLSMFLGAWGALVGILSAIARRNLIAVPAEAITHPVIVSLDDHHDKPRSSMYTQINKSDPSYE